MSEYLIKGETLTELADTMRAISDGVPNPCSIEQMKICIPNLNKKLAIPNVAFDGYTKFTCAGTNADYYTAYKTYGGYSVANIATEPFVSTKSINGNTVTYSDNFKVVNSNSTTTFKVKAMSEKGYQSSEFSEEFIIAQHSYSIGEQYSEPPTISIYKLHDADYSNSLSLGYSKIGSASYGTITLSDNNGIAYIEEGQFDYEIQRYGASYCALYITSFGTYAISDDGTTIRQKFTVERPTSL
jgi:hypothetical protein